MSRSRGLKNALLALELSSRKYGAHKVFTTVGSSVSVKTFSTSQVTGERGATASSIPAILQAGDYLAPAAAPGSHGQVSNGMLLRSELEKSFQLMPIKKLPREFTAAIYSNKQETAWKIVKEMREHPGELTCEICNYMLSASAHGRNSQLALEIFRLMKARGVVPNEVSHSCLLRALSRGGRVHEAVSRLEEIGEAAISGQTRPPNMIMFNSVLNGCAYAVNQSLADRCLAVMHRQGLSPDSESYAELMKLAGLAGNAENVRYWWKELLSKSKVSHLTYNARIMALARCGFLSEAVSALHEFCDAALNRTLEQPEGKFRGLRSNPTPQNVICEAVPRNKRSERSERNATSERSEMIERSESAERESLFLLGGKGSGGDTVRLSGKVFEGRNEVLNSLESSQESDSNEFELVKNFVQNRSDVSHILETKLDAVEAERRERLSEWETGVVDGEMGEGKFKRGWWSSGLVDSLEEWIKKEIVIAYNAIINVAGQRGDYRLAAELVSEMMEGGLKLDVHSYNAWMRAAAKGGGVESALRVWKSMKAGGLDPDRHSHEALLLAFCREGLLQEGEDLLEEMKTKGQRMAPSKHAYNALLKTCTAQGEPSRAMAIYQRMRKEKVQPDICTFLALLGSCAGPRHIGTKSGLWSMEEVMKRVLLIEEEMTRAGVHHNKATYTTVLQVLGREGLIGPMLDRLEKGRGKKDLQSLPLLDCLSFNIAIDACVRAHKMENALDILKQMQEDKVNPTVVTYNTLINGCSYAKDKPPQMALAFELADSMKSKGIVSDRTTYNSLLKVVCHGGEIDVALGLLLEMQSRGVGPDRTSFNTVLVSANRHKRLDMVEFLLEHMHRLAIPPDVTTCDLAVSSYVEEGRHDDASQALSVLSARMVLLTRRKAQAPYFTPKQNAIEELYPGAPEGDSSQGRSSAPKEDAWSGRKEAHAVPLGKVLTGEGGAMVHDELAELSDEDLLEVGVLCDDLEAMGKYMLRLSSKLDGREREWMSERSPWAARLRILYDRKVRNLTTV